MTPYKIKFTVRETDVLDLAVQGYSLKYIGNKLCISVRTVEVHVRHIYEKLEIKSRDELLDKFHSGMMFFI